MTQAEMDHLVQGIFDNVFSSITTAEPGGKPLMAPSTTVLSLMKPGVAINSKDFRNPWTPGNLAGSQDAAVNTARLVDAAPKCSSYYTDSGINISEIYKQIMDGVSIPAQKPSQAILDQLQHAHDYLYRVVNVTDPDTGAVSQATVESQVYRDYLDNQTAYFNARAAYMGAYTTAQATATGRNTWPMLAPTLQIPVKQAYDKWRSGFADLVEQNLAIMNTSSQNALSKAFSNAKQVFEGYGVTLEDSGTGLAAPIYRSSCMPSDWHSANSSSKWTTYDSASGSTSFSSSSSYQAGGGSAGFSLGLWSIGASGSHEQTHRSMSTETSGLRMHFEYTLVQIRRPWMNFSLLGTQGWNLGNLYKKGVISTGHNDALSKTGQNQNNSKMPLLPTAMVVVRNVKIKANWSKADSDFISQHTKAGGSFGWGPFSIGGNYESSSTNETYHSSFAAGEIAIPGVQIIGWISQVVPYCPPA